jgi:purine catabolism regulator
MEKNNESGRDSGCGVVNAGLEHLTVREALKIGGLRKGRVVAGHGGLENIVKNVSVIEVPEAEKWFKGNEVWLTTFFNIRDDVDKQIKMLESIAASRSAALVVCYARTYIKELSKSFLDRADQLDLPVILLPEEIAYIEVIFPILEALISRETKNLHYTIEVHEKLSNIVFAGNDISKVSRELSGILKRPVRIVDDRFQLVSESAQDHEGRQLLKQEKDFGRLLKEENRRLLFDCRVLKVEESFGQVTLWPIAFGRRFYGVLVVMDTAGLTTMENIAVGQAIMAFATILMNRAAVEGAEARKKDDFLIEMLMGQFKTNEALLAAARSLGWDLRLKKLVLVARMLYSPESSTFTREEVGRQVRRLATRDHGENVFFETEKGLVIFLHEEGERETVVARARNLGENFRKILKGFDSRGGFVAGFGSYSEQAMDLGESYHKALKTTEVLEKLKCDGLTVGIDNVLMFYFLDKLVRDKELQRYVVGQIRLLKDHDQEKGTDLYDTFVLLMMDENNKEIAEKLHIHRNTIRYRKDKIKRIFKADPFVEPFKTNYKLILSLYQMNFESD